MKVLQINATYANGSTGTIVQDLQQCCEENGIECHVAYAISRIPQHEIKNGYKIGNIVSNKLHALLCRINGKQAYFSFLPTLKLLKYIDKIQPDVIHLHNLHSNYINLNMLLRYIAKHNIATVITMHDCWFFTGGCFHYTDMNCFKWQEQCGNCPKKKQDTPAYLYDKSHEILMDRYKYLNAIKNLTVVGKKSVFKNIHCMSIHNGIDTMVFKPTPSNIRKQYGLEDKFVLLGPVTKWLSTINKDVLKTFVAGFDSDMVLLLFGYDKRSIELPNNVKVIGYTSSKEELAKLYSMADVFVNCTREDSLPTINMEAQACGTPVISFANTGVTETVNKQYGECVKTGDVIALLTGIRKIKNDKQHNYSEGLVKWILSEYKKEVNYKKYIELYKGILQ